MITKFVDEEEITMLILQYGPPKIVSSALWLNNRYDFCIQYIDPARPGPRCVDWLDVDNMEVYRIEDAVYIVDNHPDARTRNYLFKYIPKPWEDLWQK